MSRRTLLVATVVLAATLAIPLAAEARASVHGLSVRLEPPVGFASTADCADAAIYRAALHGEIGSGTNCILGEVPAECPTHVTAQFCQDVSVRMTLAFEGGSIDADVTILEAWNCAAICSVDQRWSGTVTSATERFHALQGGSVSGGGLFAFDPATFELVTFDETLVIMPAH